ncbi:MAG TPA: PQQ-binding-like beta-propeller repeat protein, partial [Gemmataceae bacterium]|nr:PQQ-binding-like beta-propeller repeat protein [Gemmataceae bacterium]
FISSGDGKDLALLCISTEGKMLWKRKLGAAGKVDIKGGEANEASNTPSTDGKHIWTFCGNGDFTCHDFEGKEIWRFNAQERYGKFDMYHGTHTTPLLHGDRLYLSLQQGTKAGGKDDRHLVIAIDKTTGKDVWKVDRPTDAKVESRQSYTTPLMWENDMENCLVIVGCDYATGHRLNDGKEIWRLSGLNPKNKTDHRIVVSPVATRDLLVVPTNRDINPIFGIKPGAQGTIAPNSPFVQWQIPKGAPDVPCPLIHDGLVYFCTAEVGKISCADLKTGKLYYSGERIGDGRYRASLVYADGHIYATGRDNGTVTVFKTGKNFQMVSNNYLPDIFAASPAISNGRIYMRGFKTLYAIEAGTK